MKKILMGKMILVMVLCLNMSLVFAGWYSDNGSPISSPPSGAEVADYYADLDNGDVFIKTVQGWELITNLHVQIEGDDNSASLTAGGSVPSSGTSGDYFFNTSTGGFYKFSSQWDILGNVYGMVHNASLKLKGLEIEDEVEGGLWGLNVVDNYGSGAGIQLQNLMVETGPAQLRTAKVLFKSEVVYEPGYSVGVLSFESDNNQGFRMDIDGNLDVDGNIKAGEVEGDGFKVEGEVAGGLWGMNLVDNYGDGAGIQLQNLTVETGPAQLKTAKALFKSVVGTEAGYSVGVLSLESDNNQGFRLDVKGTVKAEEIRVKTSGSDFVFEKDYDLRPLGEVEKHIRDNKHLPEIPSAHEMQRDGMGVSEMQTKLLQKVEELTLYLIDQNKRLEKLEKENADLKAQLKD